MKKIFMAAMVAATALFAGCEGGSAPRANMQTEVDTLSYEMGLVMSQPGGDIQNTLSQRGSDSAFVDEYLKGLLEGMTSADNKKQMAHNLGMMDGIQIRMQLPMMENQVFQGDSTKKISLKNFIAGFNDFAKENVALEVEGKPMDKETAYKKVLAYMFSSQKKESAEFMSKKAKEAGVKALEKGIYYKELVKSESTERCTETDSVVVEYTGSLANGTVFDSSERQKDGKATFDMKRMIKGWQVALPKMPVGATWELYIPWELCYGETGTQGIPPYSSLVFKVTLVKVVK